MTDAEVGARDAHGGVRETDGGERDRRHHPGQRASDSSWIVRLTTNGTGQWLLAGYRSSVLLAVVYAAIAWADVRAAVEEFTGLRVAEQLATIRQQVSDVQRRLDRIETWRDGAGHPAP